MLNFLASNSVAELPQNPLPKVVDPVPVQADISGPIVSLNPPSPLPKAVDPDSVQSNDGNIMEPLETESSLPKAVNTDLLAKGKVAAAASTGIAALLLIGGGTVHRLFNVPNDVSEDTQPRINAESKRAQQIRDADLIVIDVILYFCFIVNSVYYCYYIGS